MKVTADTNVLLRALVRDDESQARLAIALLREAELVAVPLPCLCELVWVLSGFYRFGRDRIAEAVEALADAANVVVDRPAVEFALAVFRSGGDFADGVIAHEGGWLGGETFVSFDRKAVARVSRQGRPARALA